MDITTIQASTAHKALEVLLREARPGGLLYLAESLDSVDLETAAKVSQKLRKHAEGEPCVHPGLFAQGAPDSGPEDYRAWLDLTRKCWHCGNEIPNREL